MIAILIFNLLNFGVFILYYWNFYFSDDFSKFNSSIKFIGLIERIFYSTGLLGIGSFFLSAILYLMSSCMNPGYVRASLNLLDLL